jgi:hypothetical protein
MREDLIEEQYFLKPIQYKATPWLSSLLLILQSQELLPLDF